MKITTQNDTLLESSADIVGWAVDAPPKQSKPVPSKQARGFLAAALGVPVEALAGLSDSHVEVAVSRLRSLADQCRSLAAEVTVDELTGVLRRGAGLLALQREIDRGWRSPGRGTVVVFIDADGLKAVNDTRGHAAGDRFLLDVIATLRGRLRSYDIIARYGGDEFFCVLINVEVGFVERLMEEVQQRIRQRTYGLSVSVGMSAVMPDDDAQSVVSRADQCLYAVRRTTVGSPQACDVPSRP